jgi:dolichol-phosphate mannosyltransferase
VEQAERDGFLMQASTKSDKLALVVPTLNEAGNIELLVQRVQAALSSLPVAYEVIVVDDGSTDGTCEIVRRVSEADPRVRLLVRKNQKGLAGAVLHGWQHSDGNLLGVIDADLQHPPEVLPALIAAVLDGNDIAIGSRYVNAKHVQGWNPIRQAISRLSTLVTLPFQRKKGVHVTDPMAGFFVVRREAIDGIDLQPQGFKLLLDILVRGRIHKTAEVPIQFGLRHAGKSKADVTVAFHYFSLLGKLSRDLIFRPGQQ